MSIGDIIDKIKEIETLEKELEELKYAKLHGIGPLNVDFKIQETEKLIGYYRGFNVVTD